MISINRKSFCYIDQCSWRDPLGFFGGERSVMETAFKIMTLFETKTCHVFLGPQNPCDKIFLSFVSGFVVELVSRDLKGFDNICALVASLKSMGTFLKSPCNY